MPSLWGPEPQEFVGSGDCPCGWLRIAPSAGVLPDTWLTAEPPYHADLPVPPPLPPELLGGARLAWLSSPVGLTGPHK